MTKRAIPKSRARTAYGLLSEIRRLILREPKRYNQTWWISKRGEVNDYEPERPYPSCGTVGCVAGWIVTMKEGRARGYRVEAAARRVLGLSWEESAELFDASAARGSQPQTAEHAKRGAAHIARFQKKYATQLKAKAV